MPEVRVCTGVRIDLRLCRLQSPPDEHVGNQMSPSMSALN